MCADWRIRAHDLFWICTHGNASKMEKKYTQMNGTDGESGCIAGEISGFRPNMTKWLPVIHSYSHSHSFHSKNERMTNTRIFCWMRKKKNGKKCQIKRTQQKISKSKKKNEKLSTSKQMISMKSKLVAFIIHSDCQPSTSSARYTFKCPNANS